MKGPLVALAKLLAFMLLLIFVVVLPLTVWIFNIQRAMFDEQVYERILGRRALYTRALPSVLPEMIRAENKDQEHDLPADQLPAAQLFQNLTEDDWETVIHLLMPPDWLQAQMQYNIDALFTWFDGPAVRPALRFDLTELKQRLAGQEGRRVVRLVIESWPPCSSDQARTLQHAIERGIDAGDDFPTCKPEGDLLRQLTAALDDSVATTAARMPVSLPPPDQIDRPLTPAESDQWLALKLTLRVVRRVSYLIFLLPLVLLLTIEILAVRSFKSLFRWYGWALLLGGLLTLLFSANVFPMTLFEVISGWQTGIALGTSIVFNQAFGQPILIQGAALVVTGLLFLAIASQLDWPHDQPSAELDAP